MTIYWQLEKYARVSSLRRRKFILLTQKWWQLAHDCPEIQLMYTWYKGKVGDLQLKTLLVYPPFWRHLYISSTVQKNVRSSLVSDSKEANENSKAIVEGSSNCSILQCLHWLPDHSWSWYAAGYTADFPVTTKVDFKATDIPDEWNLAWKKISQCVFLRCSQHSELPAGWLLWINPKSL